MTHIITDSTSDLTLSQAEALGVTMVSLKVVFSDGEYEDKRELTNEQFYEKLKSSPVLPTTSLVNTAQFLDLFNAHPDEDLLVITISSALSGTYQSAMLAKEHLQRDNIYIVDSRSVSIGLSLLVEEAVRARDAAIPAKEIQKMLEASAAHLRIMAIVDTLEYLVKGGRLSGFQGKVGSILGIKPIVTVNDGIVKNVAKAKGANAAVKQVAEYVQNSSNIDPARPIRYAHACNETGVALLMQKTGFGVWPVSVLGSVVGTHTGPGVVAIAYFEK